MTKTEVQLPRGRFDDGRAKIGRESLARFACGRAAASTRTLAACLLGCLLAAAVSADPSDAAMVEVRSPGGGEFVRYIADPGERNDLTFAEVPDSWPTAFRVHDRGTTVDAGTRCVSEGAHTAICAATSGAMYDLRANLGDGDDVLHPAGFNLMKVNGGPGKDVLLGGTWDDRLSGGGGTDELRGGEGMDVLSDGDRDGAPVGRGLGRDVLDGGLGLDEVTYRHRTRAVRVDLADGRPDGARNERDLVLAVEWVTGGSGNDWLAGDGDANVLDGGRGRNRLIGRAGDDVLRKPSTSRVSCGTGHDFVYAPRTPTIVPRGCERLGLRLPRSVGSDDPYLRLSPYPERKGDRRGFDIACPEFDGESLNCSAVVWIRERSTRRVLARGRIPLRGPYRPRFLRLRFTQLGRQLVIGDRRGLATARIRGQSLPTASWTIRF